MSRPSIRPCAGALSALALLLVSQYALPIGAGAQQPLPGAPTQARLQGVVVEESTGQAVEAATVEVVGTEIVSETGRYGGFAFPDARLGLMSLRVVAPGYITVVQEVEVKSDGIVFVQFRLPSVSAVLAELLVGVRPDGKPMTADALTAADMLAAEVPAARVIHGMVGKTDLQIQLRSADNSINLSNEPLVYIDGLLVGLGQALDKLTRIPASDVVDIEVLSGAAAVRYPMAANGVVLVRTRSGGGR